MRRTTNADGKEQNRSEKPDVTRDDGRRRSWTLLQHFIIRQRSSEGASHELGCCCCCQMVLILQKGGTRRPGGPARQIRFSGSAA